MNNRVKKKDIRNLAKVATIPESPNYYVPYFKAPAIRALVSHCETQCPSGLTFDRDRFYRLVLAEFGPFTATRSKVPTGFYSGSTILSFGGDKR